MGFTAPQSGPATIGWPGMLRAGGEAGKPGWGRVSARHSVRAGRQGNGGRWRGARQVFFGWQVVAAAGVVAVFSWGINFYGPSVTCTRCMRGKAGPVSLISAAITLHFLASGLLVTRLPALHRRFGLVAVTRAGLLACAAGALAWGHARRPGSWSPRRC